VKYLVILFLLIVTTVSCSKKDDNNPVDTSVSASGYIRGYVNSVNWYSNSIRTSKTGQTRIVKATQEFSNNQNYSSAILEMKISVNYIGTFGIGEDEPGFVYFVRAYYTLVGKNGNANELYTAYYKDTSELVISEYDDNHLYGTFNFVANTNDTLNTILFTNGSIQITY
jgi:hypothetical protein